MPIIKSAIKRVRQTKKAQERNKHYKTKMLTYYKKVRSLAEKGDIDKARDVLPVAVSSIDTAMKKNIIHKNNANRKKSKLGLLVDKKAEVTVKKESSKRVKKEPAKETVEKKVKKKAEKV